MSLNQQRLSQWPHQQNIQTSLRWAPSELPRTKTRPQAWRHDKQRIGKFHDSKRHLPLKQACLATHLWPSSSLVEVQADLIKLETSHWHSKNIGDIEKGLILTSLTWSFAMHCKRINPNSQHLISVSCCCCFPTQQELSHRLVALQRRRGPWLW